MGLGDYHIVCLWVCVFVFVWVILWNFEQGDIFHDINLQEQNNQSNFK